MIQKSFIFLEKIGKKLENNIWQQGITSWDSFTNTKKIKGISKKRKYYYNNQLRKAQSALYSFEPGYFLDLLPQSEMWRLYSFFKDEAVFLDIETTGVSSFDDITVIGLFDGLETKTMIKGINLDYNKLKEELKKYKLIITYNGSTFDIPFIKKRYPDLLPEIPNFDLRVACQRVGLTGGLKNIEKQLGIRRNKTIEGFYGGDVLTLWKMFRATGDEYYINLLVEYNEDDCFNLKKIADYVCSKIENGYITKS
jgi:hypothetical protein